MFKLYYFVYITGVILTVLCIEPKDYPDCKINHCFLREREIQIACETICREKYKSDHCPEYQLIPQSEPPGFCKCVCGCAAVGTQVQVSETVYKKIENITKGEKILAANDFRSWVSTPVVFSSGVTGLSQKIDMVFIRTIISDILITGEHVLPKYPGFRYCRADQLTIHDKLYAKDYSLIDIKEIYLVDYYGGIHHIGTRHIGDIFNTGNFIILNNITSGDYIMQERHGKLNPLHPTLGSLEYALQNKHNNSKIFTSDLPIVAKNILPSEPLNSIPMLPFGTLPKVHKTFPCTSNYNYEAVYFLKVLIQAVSGVEVIINYDSNLANVYSLPGNKIEIHGGLIRHTALGFDGIMAALVSSVSVFKAEPKRKDKPWASCAGDAAFYAGTYGFRATWHGEESLKKLKNGALELEQFITHGVDIKEKVHASCDYILPKCRTEVLLSGLDFNQMPNCARH